jgi:hypothetical protein
MPAGYQVDLLNASLSCLIRDRPFNFFEKWIVTHDGIHNTRGLLKTEKDGFAGDISAFSVSKF